MTIEGAGVLRGSAEERGSWPTGRSVALALLPLAAFLAVAIALGDRPQLGGLSAAQVIWFVLGPLVLISPVVAGIARANAYAPTTVLVVSSIAPAFALAARLLLEPLERDGSGRAILDATVLQERALPPAIAAVALFVAIETAGAGMRRGIVTGIVGSVAAVGIVAAGGVAILQLTGVDLPRLG